MQIEEAKGRLQRQLKRNSLSPNNQQIYYFPQEEGKFLKINIKRINTNTKRRLQKTKRKIQYNTDDKLNGLPNAGNGVERTKK